MLRGAQPVWTIPLTIGSADIRNFNYGSGSDGFEDVTLAIFCKKSAAIKVWGRLVPLDTGTAIFSQEQLLCGRLVCRLSRHRLKSRKMGTAVCLEFSF
jgi:hypothetical protein